jgi:hypothetical protein
MVWLDCHDVDSALTSLAAAIGASALELEQALLNYDDDRWALRPNEAPEDQTPLDVLEHFGTDVDHITERLAGAYCFHGTRVLDPQVFFRRGILPLDAMLEEIWAALREFSELSAQEWATFRASVETDGGGDDGRRYRFKTGDRIHFGPHGMLVREIFLYPPAGTVDYLGCSEIPQDIAWCYQSAFGLDLERRFCDASTPCIVKFRSTQRLSEAIDTALWYAFSRLRSGELPSNTSGYTGEGRAVPAEDVVDVEVVPSRR